MNISLNQITATIADLAEAGIAINKYADPTEDAADGLTVEAAEEVAREDRGLLWVDSDELDRLTFSTASELTEVQYEGALADYGTGNDGEVITFLAFGDHLQAWGADALYDSGESLVVADYIVEPGMLGESCTEEEFSRFCDALQDLAPGLNIVPSYRTQGSQSEEVAVEVMRDSKAWEMALEAVFSTI